jgi:hypothetical protein
VAEAESFIADTSPVWNWQVWSESCDGRDAKRTISAILVGFALNPRETGMPVSKNVAPRTPQYFVGQLGGFCLPADRAV